MRILIHDASVLIDLIMLDLLETALSLPCVMETTDFVKRELIHAHQQEILDKVVHEQRIIIIKSSIEEVSEIRELHGRIPALSIADCSVLIHARINNAVVLSGDRILRRTAKEQSITVYGTLWILREMVTHELLSPAEARIRLSDLMKKNPRLPEGECLRLITSWDELL